MVRVVDSNGNFLMNPNGGFLTADCYRDLCCDQVECAPCCSRITISGFPVSYNAAGDLEVTTGDVTWTVILPTKNRNVVCDGEGITISATIANPGGSPYSWAFHNDRGWIRTDYGTASSVQIDADNFVEFETANPDAFANFTYTHAFADWLVNYGTIHARQIDKDESIDVVLTPCPGTDTKDCAPCDFECLPCCWYFPCDIVAEPGRPEVVGGEVRYYNTGILGWEMEVRLIGLDPAERRVCKLTANGPESVTLRVAIRPPSDFDEFPTFFPRLCISHPGWRSEPDNATHDFVTDCAPANFVTVADPCHELVRWQDGDQSLVYELTLFVVDCDDAFCPEKDPGSIEVLSAGQWTQGVTTTDVELVVNIPVAECPNPQNVDCCDLPDCTCFDCNFRDIAPGGDGDILDNMLANFTLTDGVTVWTITTQSPQAECQWAGGLDFGGQWTLTYLGNGAWELVVADTIAQGQNATFAINAPCTGGSFNVTENGLVANGDIIGGSDCQDPST